MKKIETIDELELAIEQIDWQQIHKDRVFNDHGCSIWLYWDGNDVHTEIHSQGTIPATGNAVFGFFQCDIDNSARFYAEGWATEITDENSNHYGRFIDDESGLIITRYEMICEAIYNGEWSEAYERWAEELKDAFLSY